jgi:hypothetical protein
MMAIMGTRNEDGRLRIRVFALSLIALQRSLSRDSLLKPPDW